MHHDAQPRPGRPGPQLSRRGFLTTAAGVAVAGPLLAACGTGGSGGGTGAASKKTLHQVLPAFKPRNLVKADFPSIHGSEPGFLSIPSGNLVRTVSGTPGAGGSYTAITPLWGTIPPTSNQFSDAVNKALGATVSVSPANGNNYSTMLPALFSGNKIPDWLQAPSFWVASLHFQEAVKARFHDLTPFLAGDKALKYPNLAAINTGGWKAGVWDNRLYGIPSWTTYFSVGYQLFYRGDVMESLGLGTPSVTSMDDLWNLAREINAPKSKRWALADIFGYLYQPYNYPNWLLNDKGKVISQYQTEGIIEAMNWMAKAIKAGFVHPDEVAGNNGNGTKEFYSGQILIAAGGTGAWNLADQQQGQAANKNYRRASFDFFSADGTSKPRMAVNSATAWVSYLNKSLSTSQVEECLRIADYLAAPFGSYEWNLLEYGVEGPDYTMSGGTPALTAEGKKYAGSSVETYHFLASPNQWMYNAGAPEITTALAKWEQRNAPNLYEALFYGLNIAVPSDLSKANAFTPFTQTDNIMFEVARGRKSIADYQDTLKSWLSGGGQKLLDFYQKTYESQKSQGLA